MRRVHLRQYICHICKRTQMLPVRKKGFHHCDCLGAKQPTRMSEASTYAAMGRLAASLSSYFKETK